MQYVYVVEARSRGIIAASHVELVRAVGGNKGNMSISVRNLEAKGLVVMSRTRGGKAEAVALTREGKNRMSLLTGSFD